MGSIATSQTPWTMSYMVTEPALPSIWVKFAESTPSVPIDLSMSTWLLKIQLHVSRNNPHNQSLMSSAIAAKAKSGMPNRTVANRRVPANA